MSDESIGKLNPPTHTQTHTHTQKHVTASHSWTSAHNLIPCHCSPGTHSSALKTVIKHWFIPFKRNRNYVEKVFEKGSVLFIVKWKWWEGLLKERFITKQTCTCNFSAESEVKVQTDFVNSCQSLQEFPCHRQTRAWCYSTILWKHS